MSTDHLREFIAMLESSLEFFERSSRCLTEAQSTFKPTPESMTAAQLIAHVAMTVDWFIEGGFGNSWDMDFEAFQARLDKITSITQAREMLSLSYAAAIKRLKSIKPDMLNEPIPPGPIMAGEPRRAVIGGIVEHSAHHRGALAVYSRLCGLAPAMPYMEM